MFRNILMKRIMIKGFIVSDYMARAQEAMADLSKWVMEGKLQYRVDVRPGLENAPQVVKDLFVGANTGKLMIQISDE
jgi:NADPH-dependent curcumin reductase CurA